VNINSFKTAFRKTLPIGESFKIDIFIKRWKCTQTVIVKDELGKNTLGVDFIQKHWLHYDHDTQQLRFLQTLSKAISAVKNLTIQPLATTIVQVRSFQKTFKNQNYVADIWALKTPLINGPSSLVTFDENNLLHNMAAKLHPIWGHYRNWRHTRHCRHQKYDTNSTGRP